MLLTLAVSEAIEVVGIPGFREPISAWTHLLGAVVFLILGIRMIVRGPRQRWALGVFVFSAVFLLSMSGTYHLLYEGSGRDVLKRLDVAGVFGLIAGTFTPVIALMYRGIARWGTLTVMWLGTAACIALRTVFFEQSNGVIGLSIFLALGWMGALLTFLLWRRFGFVFVRPLLIGGIAYTMGAVFLGIGWPVVIPRVFAHHELWHVAVLVGLSSHWYFVHQAGWATVAAPD